MLDSGFCPVIAPLTHDGKGQNLNTNADTLAGEISAALTPYGNFEVETVYCFEKAGVLSDAEDDNSVIPKINKSMFESLKSEGIVRDGMIPKLDNAFRALNRGVSRLVICRAEALPRLSAGEYPGTVLTEN